MGLDMYLCKRIYLWRHGPEAEQVKVTVTKGGEPVEATYIDADKITYIEQEVGYWRKANQIHKWFVDNVQDGVDECQKSYVPREKLEELLKTVNTVLASAEMKDALVYAGTQFSGGKETVLAEPGAVMVNDEVAKKLLPTQSGFFFGNYDYDSWYVQQLEQTREILEYALSLDDNGEFEYHASW